MVVDIVAGAVIALDTVVMSLLAPRLLRKMREGGDNEWRENFRALEPARRKAITLAMRRGTPVTDPGDVDLLLRADAQLDHVRRAMRPFELMTLPIAAAALAFAVEHHVRFMLVILGTGFLFWAVTSVGAWRQQRRRKQSVAATRQLHGA